MAEELLQLKTLSSFSSGQERFETMKDEAFQAWATTLIQSLVVALILVNQSLKFFFTLIAEDMFSRMHESKIKGTKLESV